jgi:phytoene synthase
MSAGTATAEAYERCESITRAAAANFYYGIRLLPRDKRRAMCAVYAFARRIDDIGDGSLDPAEKLHRLDAAARALGGLSPAGADTGDIHLEGTDLDTDPVMVALADAHVRFALPPDALSDLIEGVRMDVLGTTYESFDELLLYCRRVAGSIGRLCLAIFHSRDPELATGLADDLGVAMQLTNILRDLREDSENGRVYLPAEDLRRFGLIAAGEERDVPAALASLAREGGKEGVDALHALMRFEGDRARQWFNRGMALAPLLDRRSAACVRAMAGIYRRLLDRIEAHPARTLHERMSLPAREKAWVAALSMLATDRGLAGKTIGGSG